MLAELGDFDNCPVLRFATLRSRLHPCMCESEDMTWDLTARELLRALRGKRSQGAFSRRLGYRSNVACDWEAGRRFPTAARTLAHCERLGLPVQAAFEAFQPACATALRTDGAFSVGRWLDALRGSTSTVALAKRSGFSRYALARWFAAQAEPPLPSFLHLVEEITGRVSDLVQALVRIEQVPSLLDAHRRRTAAKRLAFDHPWTEAILRVMETTSYRELPVHRAGYIARQLNITETQEAVALRNLEQAGILSLENGRYRDVLPLTVDTNAAPKDLNQLKAHWTRVCLERLTAPRATDWLGYNVVSLSESDLARVHDVLRHAFREIRAIAAASEPVETVALLNLQLVGWGGVE